MFLVILQGVEKVDGFLPGFSAGIFLVLAARAGVRLEVAAFILAGRGLLLSLFLVLVLSLVSGLLILATLVILLLRLGLILLIAVLGIVLSLLVLGRLALVLVFVLAALARFRKSFLPG